jgi:lipopolysaccharide biosynthesis regulator YciM
VDELEEAVARVKQKVVQMRKKIAEDTQVRKQREAYLAQLAVEYAKTRRSDDKAIQVFEHLAENPQCEMRWIQNLAMIYIIRQKWDRLKILAEKVEKRTQNK